MLASEIVVDGEGVTVTSQRSRSRATADQKAVLGRQGYVHIPAEHVFDPSFPQQLADWVDEVAAFPEVPGRWMIYCERSALDGKRIINRVENFVDYQPGFQQLITSHRIDDWVADLTGRDVVLFKDKINFKEPGADGFKPHQDAHVWEGLYEGLTRQTTVAIAIDEATPENGCLEFAPGCHEGGLLGTTLSEIPPTIAQSLPWVAEPMAPGDAMFFDSYTPHRSSPNESAFRRRMLFLTFNPAQEGDFRSRYFDDKRRSYPPDCERLPGVQYGYRI